MTRRAFLSFNRSKHLELKEKILLSAVYFKETYTSLIVLVWVFVDESKEVVHEGLLNTFHGEGFAWPSLTVGKAGDDAWGKNHIEHRLQGKFVDILSIFQVGKGVIEVKVEIFHKFGNAVYFVFRKADPDQRIGTTNRVQLSGLRFFGKNGTFSDANAKFHIRSKNVRLSDILIYFVILNHQLKVHVNDFPFLLILNLPL